MNYRFDKRTQEEFAKDIKECSLFERELMQLYVDWLNSQNKGIYTFVDNGVDNSGEFIDDHKNVTLESDFILYKNDKRPRRIEIKHCKPERGQFHLKVAHMQYCIDNNVCIVNWMNTDGPKRRFCILTPTVLQYYLKNGEQKTFWHKPCIRISNKDFVWIQV